MGTEAKELEMLEDKFGEAPESEFDDDSIIADGAKSEEFQETPKAEDESQPDKDKSQKASDDSNAEWDKDRQRADQAEANYRKANQQLESTQAKLDTQDSRIEAMQKSLDDVAAANAVNLDELDDDVVDPTIKKALKAMQVKLDAATTRAERLETSRDQIQKDLKAQGDEGRKADAQAGIISDIEEEYAAKYRNPAISKANEICTKRGYAPADRYESHQILRKCYKELADADKTPTKKTDVPTDNGASQTSVVSEETKQVSLKEAANQWRQKLRRKN